MKHFLATAFLCFLLPISCRAQGLLSAVHNSIEISAAASVEWAYGTDQPRSQKVESRFEPELNISLPFDLELTAIGRLRAYPTTRLTVRPVSQAATSVLSKRLLIGDQVDMELREFYLETTLGRALLTLGKQQIVWGQADGLKVLDVINPQDFREFILAPFGDSRIPLWAVNIELPIQDITAQFVWLPDPTFHELPQPGDLYAFTAPMFTPSPLPSVRLDLRPVERPRHLLKDSDVGLRLTTFWRGWDLSLNYLYHYYDVPTLFRRFSSSPHDPHRTLTPRYTRTHLLGGTVSNAFGNLTVRGELGYSFDRTFSTRRLSDEDGVRESNELAAVLGLDWHGFRKTFVSLQLFQTWRTNAHVGMWQKELDLNTTFFVQRTFWHERLIAEGMAIHGLDRNDGIIRPKLRYELHDNVQVWIGVDLFYGSRNGVFGEFDQNDRVVLGVEWSV